MKKILESGKLWTVLSAFIFVMTFSLVVYAATNLTTSSPYTAWKTSSTDKILDEDEWNTLMEKLQNQTNDAIPAGAVMAFNLTSCPNGWHEFTDAQGRFILGRRRYWYEFGGTGGADKVWLTVDQMPAHAHYMVADGHKDSREYVYDGNGRNHPDYPLAYEDNHDESGRTYEFSYTLAAYPGTATLGRTSTTGAGNSINIMNPYIVLLYCIKE